VLIDDGLVSREHARLRINDDEVVIEDLRSANGVYVNNVRIFGPRLLQDGDRLLLGTTELCVFAVDEERCSRTQVTSTPPEARSAGTSPVWPTDRSDAVEVLGRLAGRLLADHKPLDAEQVLVDHLSQLQSGARAGLPVPAAICTGASRQALRLARALRKGLWINYAVELHLRARLPMTLDLVGDLIYAVEVARGIDHVLYSVYVEWLRAEAPRLGAAAQQALAGLDAAKLPQR
jgi:hypothetical protein